MASASARVYKRDLGAETPAAWGPGGRKDKTKFEYFRWSTAPAPQKSGEQPLTLLPLFRRPWDQRRTEEREEDVWGGGGSVLHFSVEVVVVVAPVWL